MNARPHPGPLPQERENHLPASGKATVLGPSISFHAKKKAAAIATAANEFWSDVERLSLSPGERVGVRASVTTLFHK
jgi:hypothetical protein